MGVHGYAPHRFTGAESRAASRYDVAGNDERGWATHERKQGSRTMTTQQPPEPSSHDAQDRVINRMYLIAFLRKQVPQQEERQQGVVICGRSGVGKTIAAKVFFSAEDREDKEEAR